MTDHLSYIDRQRLHQRLVDLIRIPSVTGEEDGAIARIAEWLTECGADVDHWQEGIADIMQDPHYPGHEVARAWLPVVCGMIRGTEPGPTIMLTGHVDVVPAGDYTQWSVDPFSGVTDGDRVYGRGASDMKSGLLAALETFLTFAEGPRDFPGRVMFVAVPAEEDSGLGTLSAIRRGWKADAVIIPEPTLTDGYPKLVVAHAGAMSLTLDVAGLAAHASKRHVGESALDHYWVIHEAMRADEKRINDAEQHPLMKSLHLPYATNVGLVHGGTWSSSVMESLRAEIRIGIPLSETVDEAERRFRQAIMEGAQRDPWLKENPPVIQRLASGFGSAQTPTDHPLVTHLSESARALYGKSPVISGAPYGCDMSAWVRLTGTPTVIYGPGDIEWAHATDEWVSLQATEQVTHVLVRTVEQLLGMAKEELALDSTPEKT